eukprot:CAMPEP_0172922680 /NCGR_PEP_ID=MMETSP1075-20121228/208361_1 /TAXON_ID=2916 /ORGANISM="Ceratium fusus, Strain PA161109" /LENGTH=122 /DNA_ID=CAMNT_0013783029 /DNA_START=1 /DNA_END=365 /DNA_ORIENTATION=-
MASDGGQPSGGRRQLLPSLRPASEALPSEGRGTRPRQGEPTAAADSAAAPALGAAASRTGDGGLAEEQLDEPMRPPSPRSLGNVDADLHRSVKHLIDCEIGRELTTANTDIMKRVKKITSEL